MALKEQWVGSTEHPSESVPRWAGGFSWAGPCGAAAVSPVIIGVAVATLIGSTALPSWLFGASASLHDRSRRLDFLAEIIDRICTLCSSPKCRTAARMIALQCGTALQAAVMLCNLKLDACSAVGLLSKLEPCRSVRGALQQRSYGPRANTESVILALQLDTCHPVKG